MDKVDRLYRIYNILQHSGNASDHEVEYVKILMAVNGDTEEKKLVCQFIEQFINYFPLLSDIALETQFVLAEDSDITIRKLAVEHLPRICTIYKGFVLKTVEALSKMLQSEDSSEISTVETALLSVMEIDVKVSLKGILNILSSTENNILRQRTINFLVTKFKLLPTSVATKEIQEYVLETCKEVFPKLSYEDFMNMLQLLFNLRIIKICDTHKKVINIIAHQMKLNYNITSDNIGGFIKSVRSVLPYILPFVSTKHYVIYISLNIIPNMVAILILENGPELFLDVIKLLAELVPFTSEDEEIKVSSKIILTVLLKYVPLHPGIDVDSTSELDEPNLLITHIEGLLYIFVQLLKHNTEFFASEILNDLKSRLLYFVKGVEINIKRLQVIKKNFNLDEMNLIKNNLCAMQNIKLLIKDFIRIPPTFTPILTFSWQSPLERDQYLLFCGKQESSNKDARNLKHFKIEREAKRKLLRI